MRKFSLILTVFLILTFMPGFATLAQADCLEVDPTDHDFGDVEVGTTATTIISMTNINGSDVTIYGVEFQAESSGDFSLPSPPAVPIVLAPGNTVEVEVAFTPSADGYVSAVLEIESSDMIESTQTVFLGGVGVAVQPPPVSIQSILEFYDASIAAGTLDGTGSRDRVRKIKRKAFRFLLVAAGTLIEGGYYGWACHVLERSYVRSDGLCRPRDFVDGEARAELNGMILQLMADLGCE